MTMPERPEDARSGSKETTNAFLDEARGPRVHDVPEDLIVRFMGEHTVTIPLWSQRGLMFADSNSLLRAGIPPDLVGDVAQWGRDWNESGTSPELHLRAIALLRRLYIAFDGRYCFVYQP